MDYKFLLESLLEHLDEGILVADINANITFFNEPATNIAGIDREKAIGMNVLEIFRDLTPETSTFYHVLRTKQPLIDYVQNYTNYQGRKVSTVTSTVPLIINGEIVGAIEIYRDLTDMMELSEKVYKLQKELFKKTADVKKYSGNGTEYALDDIIGQNSIMNGLKAGVRRIASSVSPVLVYGETGTGKELLVQAIHNAGDRRDKPFIAQNCAALPETLLEGILFGTSSGSFTGAKDKPGLFELANGGTLFLDEMNSMNLSLQTKLLRVIQDGVVRRIGGAESVVVNVRVIAAMNEHPVRAVERGHLREDLYYRLNVIFFNIPPLRERKEDIPLLVEHFIKIYNVKLGKNVKGISEELMEGFIQNSWPGNVRELKYTIESMMNFIDDDVLYINEMPENAATSYYLPHETEKIRDIAKPGALKLNEALLKYEIDIIETAIKEAKGNHAKAARLLGIPRQTLHNKLKKYSIDTDED